ncbi:hypothetical protein CHU98_g3375 [Xylaria longipes]|nr:hypothetical protein CHU98_g3375 [Xylaria longipes]
MAHRAAHPLHGGCRVTREAGCHLEAYRPRNIDNSLRVDGSSRHALPSPSFHYHLSFHLTERTRLAVNISRMDDDPFNWDVDKVVQELCSPDRTWIGVPSPELPPIQQLEARLREQGADGNTILTYADESELCESLGIRTLKHKNTFAHARSELRQQSQMYKDYLNNYPASESQPAPNAQNIGLPTCGPSTARRNSRQVAPTPLSSGVNIRQVVNPNMVSQSGLIHAKPTEVEPESHNESEINICHRRVPHQQRLQAHKLFKRYLPRAQQGLGHIARNRADIITKAHDPENDIILPLYGDLDDDADLEIWEEVQDEQRITRIRRGNRTVLGNEAASHIIDEAIRSYINDWKQRKLPMLSQGANMLWEQARRHGQQSAINKVHDEIRSLEERRAKLCEGILSQQWRSISELQIILQTLEPTIIDQQTARWRLDVLKSTKEPDKLPKLPKNKNKKPRLIQPTKDAESDETLTSESESGQAGLGVEEQRCQPNTHRVHYQEPIVILDDEPEVNNKGLAMSGPIGLQVESSRSIGNLAAHQGPVTGFSTGKADSGALVSSLNLEPITDTCQNDNGLNSMKRKDSEDQDQSRAKRQKQIIEVIELSDDDDNDNQVSIRELEPMDNISDNNGSRDLDIEFGGRHANRHITEDDWRRVCKMFQCPTSTTGLKPPGFGIEIAAYQLYAIWWMLTQQPVRDIQGGCLADAMGLGKTIEVLATFAIFAMIKANYKEVVVFWKDGVMTEGRRHLPQKQTEYHDRCPSQSDSPYPTECTCIRSGDTYKIATRMPSLPTICVVPPTAMRFWAAEFCKILDMAHTVATHLRLSVRHNDYIKDQQLYHGQDRVQLTAGAVVQQLDDGKVRLLVGSRPTLSNWLVLVSRHSATKLYAMYDNMSSRASDENGDIVMNLMGAAFVFFDEAHQYNGTLDSPTDPFRFLRSLRETSVNEPVAFTVSASLPLSGPIQMVNIVDHVLRSRYLQGQEERIGGVDNAQSLKVAQTNYEYLIDNLNRGTDEKTKTKLQGRQETLDKLEKELVPCLLMARRPTDTFRGQLIGEGSREITVEHINCPMGYGLARDAFRRITAEVQSYVQRLLQEKRQEWKQDGQRGPEPTHRSIEAGLFGSGEDNNVAARMNRTSKKAWIRLIRAGVYPYLAHLLDASVIEDDDLQHEAVNQLGVAACKAYFTEGRDEMVGVFEQSSLWPHREELSQQSPRFDRLRRFIDEMISYRSRAPTADDPGPRDGTNIRHMIVLTQSPSSAFVTYMLVAHTYKENVKVVLFNAATRNDASATDNEYGRNQILDDLDSPCDHLSPNKIIISTYRICGVALNFQRANYCIMMEPAGSTEVERQAAARVNRRGQESRPVTAMLYDEHNFAELLRLSRRANHEKMLSGAKMGAAYLRNIRDGAGSIYYVGALEEWYISVVPGVPMEQLAYDGTRIPTANLVHEEAEAQTRRKPIEAKPSRYGVNQATGCSTWLISFREPVSSHWEPGVESSGRGRELVIWSLTSWATFIGEIGEPTHNQGHVLDLTFSNIPFANTERRRRLRKSSDHETLLTTIPGRGIEQLEQYHYRLRDDDVHTFVGLVATGTDQLPDTSALNTPEEIDRAAEIDILLRTIDPENLHAATSIFWCPLAAEKRTYNKRDYTGLPALYNSRKLVAQRLPTASWHQFGVDRVLVRDGGWRLESRSTLLGSADVVGDNAWIHGRWTWQPVFNQFLIFELGGYVYLIIRINAVLVFLKLQDEIDCFLRMREQLTNDRIWAPIPLEAAAASCDESSDVKPRHRDDERRSAETELVSSPQIRPGFNAGLSIAKRVRMGLLAGLGVALGRLEGHSNHRAKWIMGKRYYNLITKRGLIHSTGKAMSIYLQEYMWLDVQQRQSRALWPYPPSPRHRAGDERALRRPQIRGLPLSTRALRGPRQRLGCTLASFPTAIPIATGWSVRCKDEDASALLLQAKEKLAPHGISPEADEEWATYIRPFSLFGSKPSRPLARTTTFVQCDNCWDFHDSRTCNKKRVCVTCGKTHVPGACFGPERCVNCHSPHLASSPACLARPSIKNGRLVRLTKAQLNSLRQLGDRAYKAHRDAVSASTRKVIPIPPPRIPGQPPAATIPTIPTIETSED